MLSRVVIVSLCFIVIVGCSTPASVKTTLQAQKQAYAGLDTGLRDLQTQYVTLHQQVSEKRRVTNRYIQLTYVLKAMRGEKINPDVYAKKNRAPLQDLGKRLREGNYKADSNGAAIDYYHADIQLAFGHFRRAVKAADKVSDKQDKDITPGIRATEEQLSRIRGDIGSLRIVNQTIAEFLSIDLSPGKDASRELASSLEALRQGL